ncbi:hypothetical protein IFM89_024661 [Coptis chinensis]|uniref:KIB1-4 beta-propeller domain-containing protein n=1 Tax=Coptis chinensis TaxID=261450 RepID=A0A835IFE1_9MAGN|nr:hypothetical protein IFM89_024661 [Coptis chinensis]
MVLSTSPNAANCVIVLLGSAGRHFACWTPGVDAWQTSYLGVCAFDDAVFCNGCFYFVTSDYNIRTINAETIIQARNEKVNAWDKKQPALPLYLPPSSGNA